MRLVHSGAGLRRVTIGILNLTSLISHLCFNGFCSNFQGAFPMFCKLYLLCLLFNFSWTTTPKQQRAGIENPIINVYDIIFGEGAYFTPPYPPSMMTFHGI